MAGVTSDTENVVVVVLFMATSGARAGSLLNAFCRLNAQLM